MVWSCDAFPSVDHPCEHYVKYVPVFVPKQAMMKRMETFLFFLSSSLLSRLHLSVRNVYRKQTCFLAFTGEASYCCLCFAADGWGSDGCQGVGWWWARSPTERKEALLTSSWARLKVHVPKINLSCFYAPYTNVWVKICKDWLRCTHAAKTAVK